MATDLSTVRNRERLKPKREPYWHKLSSGTFIGYRPSAIGGSGSWIARYYDADEANYKFRALGDFAGIPAHEKFDSAKKEAEAWFDHLRGGGTRQVVTVREAAERYAKQNLESDGRFKRFVYNDPIAKVPLTRLTREHVREWRKRLESAPALVSRNKSRKPTVRPRSPASVNRDMTALRAALNLALDHGDALNDQAWRVALRPIENAGTRRNLYLDREQRRALLAELSGNVGDFFRGLCQLPLRPGALAALNAGDYDHRRSELCIGKDKAGAKRKILLPTITAELMRSLSRNKLPAAPLFAQPDGSAWNKDAWKHPIKDAARAAGLPEGTTAYVLRHSTITDLVTSGLDLLTIAQISGTSVAMIERHYGHLQRHRAAEALATLAL